ncbi:hypothetical protein BMW23_0903 [Bodo saltans virus]|jgi:hypothetical protein|uniref:Uncharacterized protein n=1 Tax=Bodo saltans virus TaxID=2024608 RepID=A0A2H4UVJ5_9VIRU|nr:hypothetical protein QJ851_gp0885 [Bodo saltans virus]ATZ80948.1 hypothetical protein BMW23_0903 [Bodo saltans virus]
MMQSNRISVEGLINYIRRNEKFFDSINIIDLNTIKEVEKLELVKLNYQNVKSIALLPNKLSKIFNINKEKYLHAGVLETLNGKEQNISLFSSILICLKQSYFSQNQQYQQKLVLTLIDCLKSDSRKFNYKKYGWDRNDLYDSLNRGFIGYNILKFLCDYLYVNIFVLEISSDELIFAGGEEYVPFKKSIFLIHYEKDIFEPMYTEHTKFFSFNDEIMKTINNNITNMKCYKLSDNIPSTITIIEENLSGVKTEDSFDKKETVNENETTDSKYTSKELKSMKMTELQTLSESLKIDIKHNNKKKTKEQLINDILSLH